MTMLALPESLLINMVAPRENLLKAVEGPTCITKGLYHGALLIGQCIWQLKAEVCRMVHISSQGAMHRGSCKEFDIGV